ncbi:MAG: ABC transporter permease [Proteobacteria bacterium]|nr:ABC transporter permease [Pseudomonadota bacterium]
MFKSYLTTALRNIRRYRLYAVINIVGLSIGLAVAIMIALFVRHEVSFDTMYADHQRIYRMNWSQVQTGARFATFFNPMSPLIAEALEGEIEQVTRLAMSERLLSVGQTTNYETITFVDPNFFEIFEHPALAGDPLTALSGPRSAVLTAPAAAKLFGPVDPMGKVFTIDGGYEFQITAVIESSPSNSHFVSNIFVNMEMLPTIWDRPNMWQAMGSDQLYHYLKLAPGVERQAIEEKILDFVLDRFGVQDDGSFATPLQPLGEVHFTTDLQNEMSIRDDITGVVKPHRQRADITIFVLVGLLTLAIACFNFMNLQIAQASKRLSEVGIRKALGAQRRDLAVQFLTESVLHAVLALIGALILIEIFLPLFSGLVAAPLEATAVFDPLVATALIGTAVLVGLISGLYPAAFFAGRIPSQVLRGEMSQGVGSAKVRAGLVVLQFAISIGLISAAGIVNTQIEYALTKSLGFNPKNVITVQINRGDMRRAYPTMRDQLLADPNIVAVSASSIVPTRDLSDGSSFQRVGEDFQAELQTRRIAVSDGFFEALGMQMVAGRPFSADFPADAMERFSPETPEVSGAVIFNETAARQAGWANPEDAIGQKLFSAFSFGGVDYRLNYEVVGIVKDAHYGSVRTKIVPVSYTLETYANVMIVRAKAGAVGPALEKIEQVWQAQVPEYPIRRSFLDDDYAALYAGESRTLGLFTGFAGIAVLIACLGLYGLAVFMAERRTKEIGIRKVLGATIANIVRLLSWDFSKLVIIANLIAWPVAWWAMQGWLGNFAYRADIDFTAFLSAGLLAFALAVATVWVHAYKAAKQNPILALRHE